MRHDSKNVHHLHVEMDGRDQAVSIALDIENVNRSATVSRDRINIVEGRL
jgi:hypothetical protein